MCDIRSDTWLGGLCMVCHESQSPWFKTQCPHNIRIPFSKETKLSSSWFELPVLTNWISLQSVPDNRLFNLSKSDWLIVQTVEMISPFLLTTTYFVSTTYDAIYAVAPKLATLQSIGQYNNLNHEFAGSCEKLIFRTWQSKSTHLKVLRKNTHASLWSLAKRSRSQKKRCLNL